MAKCKLPGDECRHDGGCDTCKYAEDEAQVETITGDPMIHGVAPEGGDEADPVLKAIDMAKWSDYEIDNLVCLRHADIVTYIHGANRQIEAIRTAYLASKKKGGHCK